MNHKKVENNLEISCFEVLDVLFWELKASNPEPDPKPWIRSKTLFLTAAHFSPLLLSFDSKMLHGYAPPTLKLCLLTSHFAYNK